MANTGAANTNAANEQALLNQLQGEAAPTTAAGQLQYNLGQNELGLVNANVSQQQAYNNAMTGYDAQNLGLTEQGTAISGLGLQEQGAQNTQQQGLEQQEYGLQSGQYPEQQAEAALAYQNTMMQTAGGQAISGTANTVGGRQTVATNAANYGFQTEDIARSQALAGLGQQSEESGYQYSGEELQNAQANLALSAQANGLSEQQMLTMLNYGNTQAGESGAQDIIQLLSQQGSTASGNLSSVGSALSPIGFAAGVNAQAGIP